MESNLSRGKRTLFWMKATLVTTILVGILALIVMNAASGNVHSMEQFSVENPDAEAAMDVLASIVALVFAGFAMLLVWSVYQLFWLCWIFRITKNLRKVTTTAFGPWLAVICSSIPYVGLLIHYFIFKNLVKQTESALSARRDSRSKTVAEILSKVQPVDQNMVNGFAIMATLAGAIGFIRDSNVSAVLAIVFSVISMVCYIKSFAALIKEEQAMFEVYEDEKLMAKVDQVLWQRKMEESASSQSQNSDEKT